MLSTYLRALERSRLLDPHLLPMAVGHADPPAHAFVARGIVGAACTLEAWLVAHDTHHRAWLICAALWLLGWLACIGGALVIGRWIWREVADG